MWPKIQEKKMVQIIYKLQKKTVSSATFIYFLKKIENFSFNVNSIEKNDKMISFFVFVALAIN